MQIQLLLVNVLSKFELIQPSHFLLLLKVFDKLLYTALLPLCRLVAQDLLAIVFARARQMQQQCERQQIQIEHAATRYVASDS